MDSKQLYRFYQNKYYSSNWLNENGELAQSEGEVNWSYCGVGEDFKSEIVNQAINTFTGDDDIYLCISPGKSLLVSKSDATQEIGNILHKKEIGIINKSYTKIMHFTQCGVFKSGIIREFPKTRLRPDGMPLKVLFNANIVDNNTKRIPDIIRKHLKNLEIALYNDYGGAMENLWIDLELIEDSTPWSFRFQKRVDNPSSYTDFYSYNVGHYSVKPDFEKLKNLSSEESICSYIIELLYDSTQILVDKQKKLNGFDATRFQSDFLLACQSVIRK